MERKNRLRSASFIALGAASCLALGFTFGKIAGEITPQSIDGASDLIGLTFSPAEKDSMINTLKNQLNNIESSRKVELDNSIAPSLVFNPLPQGFHPSTEQMPLNWGLEKAIELPASDVDIAYSPVHQLAVLIKSKKLSSERLTKIYLDRIKAHSDTLQCLITLMEDSALEKAREMDAELAAGKYRGPLHGIPYGIKDLLAVKGTKTTWGAMPYKDQKIEETAEIVTKLNDAGAVLVGKFTLGALAMGDVWYGGVTKNPWNLKQGSSGSSAGSASAVSAGLVPFAIGTETLGSIVSPSTRNGVTGLRPTYGRVSKHGAMALSWSMDKIGPISRSALDNGIILSVINGKDEKDASSIAAAFNYDANQDPKKLKVGYFKPFFETERTSENDKKVLEELIGLGIELHPLELKTSVQAGPIVMMLMVEGAAAFDNLTRLGWDDQLVAQHKNAWPNLFRAARFIPAVEYVNLSRQRTLLIQEMHELMKDYDVVVTPSFGGPQLQITNLTGHPALCIPNGFNDNGSPTSITLLGNLFEEDKLVLLGNYLQKNTDWQAKRPPLFNR
ncbi:amidase [Algoriphagus zhangzhouensis]|uniref:Asp-tRNAAsn/Glu-tRNAGln amidotransferase A subunit n=1 Tax=Algoriphagus zhangzhouensis TaxID=1073327 RepID=A0A1M7ZBB1_9BACT|nr:amidase [Algoriphagus zhangzhouensis]TDY46888.1 Asp-tRNA(Asn)/Glu-tRNA(Gln) amidotransferase A subunit family amidase [Algoriphagus zhangzhouensis]SHO62153.1 Asp-tRNAAsn/Glu-tRNAGln amidotransferase A subunit [Algoriphagus zhangzhouensis]